MCMHTGERERVYRRDGRGGKRGGEDRKKITVQRNTHQCKMTVNEIDDCTETVFSLLKGICISSSI